MKKRLFAVLVIVALVVTAAVFAVAAEETENPFEGQTGKVVAYCEHCKEDKEWTAVDTSLSAALSFSDGAHLYLKGNTDSTAHTGFANMSLCLNLNGFTYRRTNSGTPFGISTGATMNIFDTSAEGTGRIYNNMGGATYCIQQSDGVVNFYSGIIEAEKTKSFSGHGAAVTITKGEFNLLGGEIIGGTTSGNGGSVYVAGAAVMNIESGSIHGGTSKSAGQGGGNLYIAGTVNMRGGSIYGGTATVGCGGNVHIISNGKFNMTGGNIYGGKSGNWGGNISTTYAGVVIDIQGGFVDGSKATAKNDNQGANIGVYKGTLKIGGDAVVTSGKARANITTNDDASAKIELSGDAIVDYVTLGSNAAGTVLSELTIKADYAGSAIISYRRPSTMTFNPGDALKCVKVEADYDQGDNKFKVYDASSSLLPAYREGSALKVAAFSGLTSDANGNVEEYALPDLIDAIDYDYIKLYSNQDVELTCDTTLEINNKIVKVATGGHTLSLINYRNENAGYTYGAPGETAAKCRGRVTVDNINNVRSVATNPHNGNTYFAIHEGEGVFTSHRLSIKLDKVSVRSAENSAGIYYTTKIQCDAVLQEYIQNYGVAVTLTGPINANFAEVAAEKGILYTSQTFADVKTEDQTSYNAYSALVENILSTEKREKTNNEYGKMPIYANAYVTVAIDEEIVTVMAQNPVEISLFDIMAKLNEQYADVESSDEIPQEIIAFVAKWGAKEDMGTWGLINLMV